MRSFLFVLVLSFLPLASVQAAADCSSCVEMEKFYKSLKDRRSTAERKLVAEDIGDYLSTFSLSDNAKVRTQEIPWIVTLTLEAVPYDEMFLIPNYAMMIQMNYEKEFQAYLNKQPPTVRKAYQSLIDKAGDGFSEDR